MGSPETGKSITRQRVQLRARFGWAKESVPYNSGTVHQPDGYIQNAIGFVLMCWDAPPNLTIISLESEGWVTEIAPLEMQMGDAMGLLGPSGIDTTGGVLVLFEGWLNNDPKTGYAMCYEQLPDYSPGPIRRARPFDSIHWRCYRYRNITD